MAFALAAAPLRGQPRRLVQDDDVLVLPKHAGLDHLRIRGRDAFGPVGRRGGGVGQGGDADGLAGGDPVACLGPRAVDAQLAGAAQLFHRALRHLRKAALQPAVKALLALVLGHGDHLDGGHAKRPSQGKARRDGDKRQGDRSGDIERGLRGFPAFPQLQASSEKAEKVVNPPRSPVSSNGDRAVRVVSRT